MTEPVVAPALRGLLRDVASLREDKENLRLHDGRSVDAIVRSLEQFGQQKPIVIGADGTVLAGNGMFRAARVLGWRQVACVVFGGTRDEALAYAIADNRTAEKSGWNTERLQREVATLLELDAEIVGALGFTEKEIERMEAAIRSTVEVSELPAGPGAGDGEGREREEVPASAPILTSVLVFSGERPEIEVWYDFLTELRDQYPECQTVGERLAAFVGSLT